MQASGEFPTFIGMTSAMNPATAAALGLRAALVTGATSGIGWHLALQLADAGVHVVVVGRSASRLAELARLRPCISPLQADLADAGSLRALAERISAEAPELNCLIHNAAIQHNVRMDDAGYDLDAIEQEIDTNLLAPIALTHALLPALQLRERSWIVHLSSGLAYAPKRTSAVYSASKAALHLFGDALREQLRGSSVRVLEVVMPLVDTPMTHGRGRSKLAPDKAAAALLAGLSHPGGVVHVGQAKALPVLRRVAPGLLARVMRAA
jgi:uncharacterized oxidoreductase